MREFLQQKFRSWSWIHFLIDGAITLLLSAVVSSALKMRWWELSLFALGAVLLVTVVIALGMRWWGARPSTSVNYSLQELGVGEFDKQILPNFVQVFGIAFEYNKLQEPDLQVVFHFFGFNGAVFGVDLRDAKGHISFGGSELAGNLELISDDVNIPRARRFQFTLRQWISKEDAKRILETPSPGNKHVRFGFERVEVLFGIRQPFQDDTSHQLRLPKEIQLDTEERWSTGRLALCTPSSQP